MNPKTNTVLKINPPTVPKPKRVVVDWERVEFDYRAGVKTLREIADENDVTHGAINKRAKRDGWTRDLNARIQAKADLLVSKQAVSTEVSKSRLATEKQIVEVNAEALAAVKIAHRTHIKRFQNMVLRLLEEIEIQTEHPAEFAELAEVIIMQEVQGEGLQTKDEVRRMQQMQRLFEMVMSTPSRVDSMKKLADTLKTLIGLEREAFGIDKGIDKSQSIGEFLESLQ